MNGRTTLERPLGRLSERAMSPRRRAAAAGFTLVEILLVVSILIALAAIVLVSGGALLEGTRERATKAQIERLSLHIEKYRGITGRLPPDGIDSEVMNEQGIALRGSAALWYALTQPIEARIMAGGIPRVVEHDAVVLQFPEGELTPRDDEYPGVREIIDAFGVPLHYDNTSDGVFRPQGGEVHYPSLDDGDHPPDPRTIEGPDKGGVEVPDRNQSPTYDLWSHGRRGHDMAEDPSRPIATWNLKD